MNKSYINEQELQSFYRDFNNKALDLLGEYNTMEYALNDGASYIEGDTQSAVTDASEKVATTKKRIEDILLRYNECMSNSIESMAGLDAGAVSKMKGELANLSEGAKKRSGSGGGSSGGGSNGGSSGGGNGTGGGSNGGSSGGGNETGGGSNGGNGSGSNGNNQTDQNNNEAKKPYKPSNDYYKKPDPDPRPKPDPSNNAELEARIKALQEKMRQLQEELSKKRYTDPTPRPDPTPVPIPRPDPTPRPDPIKKPDFTPTTGDTPSTGTNFKNPTDNNVGTGSELGTTTNDKDSLEKMSTGTEAETPNLEDGEVIEEGNLTDVSPTDLSDENLELGATDDTLVSEDKSGSNNLLKFAGIGGMLLGSGALAAGLATKKDEEELSAEETTEEASDELEDEYSQELKDFYE